MRYRKKPVEIEAVQFYLPFNGEWFEFFEDFTDWGYSPDSRTLYIETLEGTMTAQEGDWIIKGVAGEFYPCKPDIFEATYEGPICDNCGTPNPLNNHWAETLGRCYIGGP